MRTKIIRRRIRPWNGIRFEKIDDSWYKGNKSDISIEVMQLKNDNWIATIWHKENKYIDSAVGSNPKKALIELDKTTSQYRECLKKIFR